MRDIKTFFTMLKYIGELLNKKQKIELIWVMLLIIVSSLFEMLGISAVLPLVQVFLEPDKLMDDRYIQWIMKIFGLSNSQQLTILIGLGFILVYIIKNAVMALAGYVKLFYANSMNRDMAVLVMKSYMYRPYEFFTTHTTSDITRGVGGDASSVFAIILCLLNIATYTITSVCIGIYLFSTDIIMAISILAIGLCCILLTVLSIKKKMAKLGRQNREASREVSSVTIQIVHGMKEIFMKQKRQYFLERFKTSKELQKKTNIGFSFINILPLRIIESMSVIGIIIAVLIRMAIGVDTHAFVSSLAVFALAGFKIMPYTSNISGELSNLVYYRPSLDAAYKDVMEAKNYIAKQEIMTLSDESEQYAVFSHQIKLEDIAWKYEKGENFVLQNLNLTIQKSEVIGIIGESGAGKSTLSDILLGLYKPQKGTVKMDDIEIFEHPMIWSNMIGYIPQSTYLFDDDIRRNVAFGDAEPDENRIWESLEKASLKLFVESLPEGLNTRVGERGIMLSGGQRQRVAIARALYSKPQILVMDEATSALDNETETAVMEAIESLHGSMTIIIIAHRITTLRKCDKIYKIEKGVAAEVNKESIFDANKENSIKG